MADKDSGNISASNSPTDIVEKFAYKSASSTLNSFVTTGGNTRELEFLSNDLGKELDLLLMFEPPQVGKLYVDLFPVCWKVISFGATGLGSASVQYTADTGFFVPQNRSGNRVSASNAQRCQSGEKCALRTNANKNGSYITKAVPSKAPKALQCVNETERPASIGIGFMNEAGTKMEPALVWNNIAKDSTLSTELTPKLKIYAVSDYKETQLIRGDIESPLLFEKNLISLPNSTEWKVSIDEGTGKVVIEEA
ncbi:hypothetical protein JR316_0012709 [Psilocybe cubensis]|uniref:Uncharacterized protein n=2 Tax=Psilocybe cubensis TaxID=181762 RepID=A0A8H7XLL8_PSICU|nr:hypothetical protein JR316_0012709 [Psilocybe cubensis]KAH9475592.1 hypothetical protein JR316_0012709 [Psilocybe cubensis]